MAKNLVKRGGTYSVRYVVPVKYRGLLGRSQIWKSTGTGDLRQAEQRKHRIIAAIQDGIDRQVRLMKAGKFTESALNPKSTEYVRMVAENLRSGELNTDDAAEILMEYRDEHLAALRLDPEAIAEATRAAVLEDDPGADPARVDAAVTKALTEAIGGDHLEFLRSSTALVSNPDALPLNRAIDDYLGENEKQWPLSTWERKRKWLESFSDWAGNPDIQAITRKVAGRYMSEVLQPMDASWSTKNWILSTLSPFFNWANRRGLYDDANPWTGMSTDLQESKRGAVKQGKRRPWTDDELKKLSALPQDDPVYQVGMLSLWAGLRTEEASCLKVKDINLKDRFLVVSEGKNVHSVRQLPIHSKLLPLVKKLVKQSKDGWLIPGLIPGGRDKRRSHNLSKRANRWIRANVSTDKGLVFYSLRKTFGTALENAGVDLTRRQRLMGHTPGDITSAIYSAGPELETLRESIERIYLPVV